MFIGDDRMEKDNFKPYVVWLILDGKTEDALETLANHYAVTVPKLRVGLPKRHTKAFGCYTNKTQTIAVLNSDIFLNPFVILHEFYHHLRSKSVDKMHKGTEGNADKFAIDFLKEYQNYLIKTAQSLPYNLP